MATPTIGPESRKRKAALAAKIIVVLFVLLIAISFVLAALLVHMAHAALPQLDGSIALAGLTAPVSVIRDAQGVPHITAQNAADLFFAQGYVTAQDRLWEMDMSRRYTAGELSEVLGAAYINIDKQQRILRLRGVAEDGVAHLSERDRDHLEAYARGVNAYIEQHHDALPLEFRVLRYAPRRWTPADSLLCGILMSEMLNGNEWQVKLEREAVTARLSPELAADLYPTTSWRDHPPAQPQANFDEASPAEPKHASAPRKDSRGPVAGGRWPDGSGALLPQTASQSQSDIGSAESSALPLPTAGGQWPPASIPDEAPALGSNNWVISGAHTATGKPLLANDMHLAHRIPNVWYEAQLRIETGPSAPTTDDRRPTASFDVAGFTIPGMPYVIAGHNQRIAWGFTNIMPDVQDLYIEQVNDRGEYLTPQGWKPLDVKREVIHVKGKPDVTVETRATRHGPLVNELVGEKRALALRWTLYELPAGTTFFDVDSAQNWDEFRRAFSEFVGPGQNVVYADVDGHIGYQATGRVPLRRADILVPVNGADDAHEWSGYIPFDAMPRVFDPPSGIIATANSRIAPDHYPYTVSTSWDAPPYRTQRIYRLLSANKQFTAADMLAIQTDIFSSYDLFCAQRFTYAVDHATNATKEARAAADVLRGWDGRVLATSSAPTIVALARRQLWRLLLEPKLGPAADPVTARRGLGSATRLTGWAAYQWPYSSVALENIMERQPARWLPPQFHSYDELLTAAVTAAIAQAHSSETKLTQARWHWGERYPLSIQHPIFGSVPILRRWSGPGTVPQNGDGTTIKAAGQEFGPSERFTADLADLDHSAMNIVTGESGNLFSPHYMDQWKAWYGGSTFAFPFSAGAVRQAKKHGLTLTQR